MRSVLYAFNFDIDFCRINRNVLVNPVRSGPFQASMNRIDNAGGYDDEANMEVIPSFLFFSCQFFQGLNTFQVTTMAANLTVGNAKRDSIQEM